MAGVLRMGGTARRTEQPSRTIKTVVYGSGAVSQEGPAAEEYCHDELTKIYQEYGMRLRSLMAEHGEMAPE